MALVASAWLTACAAHRGLGPRAEQPVQWDEPTFARKTIDSYTLQLDAAGRPVDTVIGRPQTYEVRKGDTLLDVARYYDLGYNEIVAANPGVDPWVPTPGTEIVLPTEWVLPCCAYDGIVVNIPEMRLYHYRRPRGAKGTLTVSTYPVGLGRDDRRTPRGAFRVASKTVNPTWNIPESIRREHIAERGDHRRSIPGGAPDNPLGKHRLSLADSRYAIHGTNIPWGVGMQVSHGCLRLYPEDIERWFPDVPVGTRVQFVYQPVKAGERGGDAYVEVHEDIYRYERSLKATARKALQQRKLGAVDDALLRTAVGESHGVPVRVSRQTQQARAARPATVAAD
ncbi:MAG: L,D-transpeptidase family protein [Thermodesulfobacteriota bacterium]